MNQKALFTDFRTLAFMLVALGVVSGTFDGRTEPASDPAGFYRIECLGNSDTIVSIPFTRPQAASAIVESVSGNVVTVKGSPSWTVDQFVYVPVTQSNTYYLRLISSAKEGSYYPIVANNASSLTLDLSGDDISSVTNGTRLSVIPYWTLGTAFPAGRGVVPSSTIGNRRTEVLIPNFSGVGINLSASATYFFLTNATFPNGVWRKVGDGTAHGDDVLLPDVYFIVRHNTTTNTIFTAQGSVPTSKLSTPLITQLQTTNQDNFIALTRPVTNTLLESGLVQSGAFVPSVSLGNRKDELIAFDNTQIAQNKSAAATYFYLSGTWRRVGVGGDWGNEPVFKPGTGVIIRKAATVDGASTNWINTPSY